MKRWQRPRLKAAAVKAREEGAQVQVLSLFASTAETNEQKESESSATAGSTARHKHMSDASKPKGKQKWTIERPKLDNAGQLRGIFFIEPDDEEFECIAKCR